MALNEDQMIRIVNRVNILIPETTAETQLLQQLAADSAAFVESYTGRRSIPVQLESAVGDLVIIAYNRLGTEGEKARNEGGASLTFETAPAHVYDVLNRNRLARAGGVTHETAETES